LFTSRSKSAYVEKRQTPCVFVSALAQFERANIGEQALGAEAEQILVETNSQGEQEDCYA